MNKEFFEALSLLQKENKISGEVLIEKIRQGVIKAIKKDYQDCENINVVIDPEKSKFEMSLIKTVVEGVPETADEINIDEAKTIDPGAMIGGVCEIKLSTTQFGRVAAQSAKQSIRHDIKEF
ncbi:MAG: NusA N-terminal domain-containing protein, partial [Oscillospiraceae bacterium]